MAGKMQRRIAAANRGKLAPVVERVENPIRVAAHTKRNYLLAGTGLGLGLAGSYAMARRRNVYKLYDPFTDADVEIGKADRRNSPAYNSGGRTALAVMAPGWHGAIAGRKGKKVRAGANEALPGIAAGVAGGIAMNRLAWNGRPRAALAAGLGGMALGRGGAYLGHRRNLRRDYLKPVEKAAFPLEVTGGTDVRWLPARTPGGQFVSHANKLKVIHITPKRNPTSRLVRVTRGSRTAAGSAVGKADLKGLLAPYRATRVPAARLRQLTDTPSAPSELSRRLKSRQRFGDTPRRGRRLPD